MKVILGTLCWTTRIAPLVVRFGFKQAAFYLRGSSVYSIVQSVLSLVEGGNVEMHGQESEH